MMTADFMKKIEDLHADASQIKKEFQITANKNDTLQKALTDNQARNTELVLSLRRLKSDCDDLKERNSRLSLECLIKEDEKKKLSQQVELYRPTYEMYWNIR